MGFFPGSGETRQHFQSLYTRTTEHHIQCGNTQFLIDMCNHPAYVNAKTTN